MGKGGELRGQQEERGEGERTIETDSVLSDDVT